jgi:hypothetical protein
VNARLLLGRGECLGARLGSRVYDETCSKTNLR